MGHAGDDVAAGPREVLEPVDAHPHTQAGGDDPPHDAGHAVRDPGMAAHPAMESRRELAFVRHSEAIMTGSPSQPV